MNELAAVREELSQARADLRHKEEAPLDGRVVDEDRYQVALLRLRNRVKALEAEERRLTNECPCEGGDSCVC